jgi:cytochrome c peroxidase
VDGLPEDRGRASAVRQVIADPFNCFGPYSDGKEEDCRELAFMVPGGEQLERAYKTPSLRGAAARAPYMHAGQFLSLDEVIDHYSRAPEAPSGESEIRALEFTDRGRASLIAFLKTLEP